MSRRIKVHPKNTEPCPNCNSVGDLTVLSQQISKDSCEVWVKCSNCHYDPTKTLWGARVESIMGGTQNETDVRGAIKVWNTEIRGVEV